MLFRSDRKVLSHLGQTLPSWPFTSERFGTIIYNFHLFLQHHFRYRLSWPSSNLLASSDWVIGPMAQSIQPQQYFIDNWSPQFWFKKWYKLKILLSSFSSLCIVLFLLNFIYFQINLLSNKIIIFNFYLVIARVSD